MTKHTISAQKYDRNKNVFSSYGYENGTCILSYNYYFDPFDADGYYLNIDLKSTQQPTVSCIVDCVSIFLKSAEIINTLTESKITQQNVLEVCRNILLTKINHLHAYCYTVMAAKSLGLNTRHYLATDKDGFNRASSAHRVLSKEVIKKFDRLFSF